MRPPACLKATPRVFFPTAMPANANGSASGTCASTFRLASQTRSESRPQAPGQIGWARPDPQVFHPRQLLLPVSHQIFRQCVRHAHGLKSSITFEFTGVDHPQPRGAAATQSGSRAGGCASESLLEHAAQRPNARPGRDPPATPVSGRQTRARFAGLAAYTCSARKTHDHRRCREAPWLHRGLAQCSSAAAGRSRWNDAGAKDGMATRAGRTVVPPDRAAGRADCLVGGTRAVNLGLPATIYFHFLHMGNDYC